MTHSYEIEGMSCGDCVAKVKGELLKIGDITEAHVGLAAPQATLTMQKHIATDVLQSALAKAGNFKITEADGGDHHTQPAAEAKSWFTTYKPILIVGAYLMGITLLVEATGDGFTWKSWMSNFMAGFFLVFSFFKLLDLRGFADSYATYDIVAKKWKGWGYIYAFVELGLGVAYLLKFNPLFTNAVTFAVMSISIIGVLQSVLNKRKIRCACLGSVFNLPMSTLTITEDALMIAMSAAMIITMT